MRTGQQPQGEQPPRQAISKALAAIPSGLFILTAQHEDRRMGMLTSLVQQVCFEPPMICVAIAKGRSIMPLISESRQFGLCQLATDNKIILRKFAGNLDPAEDPFLGLELVRPHLPNLPLLGAAMTHMECELTCHMDVEGDHDLFIGAVRNAGCNGGQPHVHIRDDGFKY